MSQNICEYLREEAIKGLFELTTVKKAWPTWRQEITNRIGNLNAPLNIINLGDHLSEVFRSTSSSGRSQASISGGGTGWEALVCWYLNLCLLETRTVVIKFKKSLIPKPVREAITVRYGTFPSNTESDLIAITFPNKEEYTTMDKFAIQTRDTQGDLIPPATRGGKFNYSNIIDSLTDRDFNELEIGIIQCKTNWNDNAQIPMLWDMIYSSTGFEGHRITVGSSAYSIKDIHRFTYSFVTVPTSSDGGNDIKPSSTCVKRVQNLTGGNYWGKPTVPSIANSIKEIFGKNFSSASPTALRNTLASAMGQIGSTYSYFNLV
ncbi:hypothetical protein ACFFJQ_14270 [Bacillus capparidis]|uniref:Restriction endonuclease n=1 Tax=Bacillus capparidis TaxID=1840411 RepID=A0ABS4CUQ3_9BACI|nr:hypothetical protein [Bacillus capparidis]MBP1080770.1 hypothetical protein [Bacillus capparidis]MED1094622.1 hypothetical protein [Bacillus capparidis]